MIKDILRISFFSIIGFLLVEMVFRFVSDLNPLSENEFTRNSLLFQSGDNFLNIDNFFSYYPNKSIRISSIFYSQPLADLSDIRIEYDYTIETNNAGLVMKEDIFKGDDVILVMGDSFTEGQGAQSWFYDVEKLDQVPFKLVNLGQLGTGPQTWELVKDYLVLKYDLNIKGIIINLIIPDLTRDVWNFNDQQLKCLRFADCSYHGGVMGFDFKRLNFDSEIATDFIDHVNEVDNKIAPHNQVAWQFEYFKDILRKSRSLVAIKSFLSLQLNPKISRKVDKNILALQRLFNSVGKNKRIILINTKPYSQSPLIEKKSNIFKRMVYAGIEEDHLVWCNPTLAGFHPNDSHPNSHGYAKLKSCFINSIMGLELPFSKVSQN